MDENAGIKQLFLEAVKRDKPDPMFTDWALQFSQETREQNVFGLDFKDYKEGDLKKWMDMCSEFEFPCYLPKELTEPIIEKAYEKDKQFGIPYENYRIHIGQENAIDYLIPRMFKKDINSVLDFGAGYGRNGNLWGEKHYFAMDGILNSYCCQSKYFQSIIHGIYYHLKTWEVDELKNYSFDMVMCVQVLPELSEQLLTKMLTEFHRVLKVGGIIYIRDHNTKWRPCNNVNVHQFLLDLGFEVGKTDDPNWKENIVDGVDLHGIPRIYVKRR